MKIFNRIFLRNQYGFTLVEAVVAISIIGVIGVIMSEILTRAFDNTQKTNLISNVQQNGQAALSSFEDTIRYSEFVCVGGYAADKISPLQPNTLTEYYRPVLVVFKDGKYIRIRIVPEIGNTNGYISEDFPADPAVDSTGLELCRTVQLLNMRKITNDTSSPTGLSVKRGTITLLSNPINGATIGTSKVSLTIQFAIGSTYNAAVSPESQIGQNNEIVFQTTAQFR